MPVTEVTIEIEKEVEVEVEVEKIVEVFDHFKLREDAWTYILDNWYNEDFDDKLKYCDDENYFKGEIAWEFADEFGYLFEDFDKNKWNLYFSLTGDYASECEASYDISVEYYKDRVPEVTIE
jgi:hypothetical protein